MLEYWPECFADTPSNLESPEAVDVVASCTVVVAAAEEAVAAVADVESHLLEYHP